MHATKDDVFGVSLGGEARQLQRVTGEIGVLIHVGPLVMVAKQDGLLAELGARGANASVAVCVGELVELVKLDDGGVHYVSRMLLWMKERLCRPDLVLEPSPGSKGRTACGGELPMRFSRSTAGRRDANR